jgi:hypothetical protein
MHCAASAEVSSYRWTHRALRAEPARVEALRDALDAWARTGEASALRVVWSQACERRYLLEDEATTAVDPEVLREALTWAASLTPAASDVPVRPLVRRAAWRRLCEKREELLALQSLDAPEAVLAGSLADIEDCVRSLYAPSPRGSAPELPLARHLDELGQIVFFPDPWEILQQFVSSLDPFGDSDLGLGEALEGLAAHQRFRREHARVWPQTVGPLDNGPLGFFREDTAQDHHPDRALWLPPGACLPQLVWDPREVRAELQPLLGGQTRAGAAHVGVGPMGGPMTYITPSTPETPVWPLAPALARAVSAALAEGLAVVAWVELVAD